MFRRFGPECHHTPSSDCRLSFLHLALLCSGKELVLVVLVTDKLEQCKCKCPEPSCTVPEYAGSKVQEFVQICGLRGEQGGD